MFNTHDIDCGYVVFTNLLKDHHMILRQRAEPLNAHIYKSIAKIRLGAAKTNQTKASLN